MLSALKNFGITFGVGLIIFGLLAFGITKFAVNSFANGFTSDQSQDDTASNAADDGSNETKMDLSGIEGQTFTALLVGVDYFPDQLDNYGASFADCYSKSSETTLYTPETVPSELCTYIKQREISADTIVLFHVNREQQTFVIYSIPYHTRVLVDGNYTKLGSLIYSKGMDFFTAKVEALTGMHVDYHMVFTPRGFVNLMQSLDQTTFNVPCNMSYQDPAQSLNINVRAGEQRLGGADMLRVLRFAGYENGEEGRMETTRNFITTMLSNMKNITSLENATELYRTMLAYIYTNMDAAAFASIADLVYCYDGFTCISQAYPGSEVTYEGERYFEPTIVQATEFFRTYR